MTAVEIQVRPRESAIRAMRERGAWERRQWKTIAYVNDETEAEQTAARFVDRAPPALYEYRTTRRRNPPSHLHIPATVAQLGVVLDLTTQSDLQRTLWEADDVGGMLMCCDADAMEREPGTAALYLLRVSSNKSRNSNGAKEDERADAETTYQEWHERAPSRVTHAEDLPDLIGIYCGRARRIGYRSDKWHKRGTTEDYDHDYTEPQYEMPEVWADNADLALANAIVIVGGNQRITADGID